MRTFKLCVERTHFRKVFSEQIFVIHIYEHIYVNKYSEIYKEFIRYMGPLGMRIFVYSWNYF